MRAGAGPADAAPLGSKRKIRIVCKICGLNAFDTTKINTEPVCFPCKAARKTSVCGGCGKEVAEDVTTVTTVQGRKWHKGCAEAFGYSSSPLSSPPLAAPLSSASHRKAAGPLVDHGHSLHGSSKKPSPRACKDVLEEYGHMNTSIFGVKAVESFLDASAVEEQRRPQLTSPTTIAVWAQHLPEAADLSPRALTMPLPEVTPYDLKPPKVSLPFSNAFIYDEDHPPSKPFVSYSLEGIVRRIQAMGLLRERTWRFKTYRNVFIGKEFVDYLLTTRQCSTRAECVGIGKLLIQYGMIGNATGEKVENFEDRDTALYTVTLRRKRNARDDILAESTPQSAPAARPPLPSISSMTGGSATPKRSFFGTPFKKTATIAPMPPSGTDGASFTENSRSPEHTASLYPSERLTMQQDSLTRSWETRDSELHRYGSAADETGTDSGFIGVVETGGGEPLRRHMRQHSREMSPVDEGHDSDRYHSDGSLPGSSRHGRSSASPSRRVLRPTKSASHIKTGSGTVSADDAGDDSELDEGGDNGTPAHSRKSSGGSSSTKPPAPSSLGDAVAEARRKLITKRIELESRHVHEGWMVKQGHNFKNWRRRYFVLSGYDLAYYRKAPHPVTGLTGMAPARLIDIRDFTLEEAHVKRSSLCMKLVSKRHLDNEYLVYCETESDFVAWVKAISMTMRDFDELEKQWMELQGATVRATAGTGTVTYSLLGGR